MKRRRPRGFSALFSVVTAVLLSVWLAGGGAGALPPVQTLAQETGVVLCAQAKETTDYQATAYLNVRSKASKSGKILGGYAKGDTVSVYSIDGDWAKVSYNGTTAYVAAKYLGEMGSVSASRSSGGSTSTSAGCSSTTTSAGGGGSAGSDADMVWLSATGSKYHSIDHCGRMNPNKAYQVTRKEAEAEGYEPCRKCW